MTGPRLHIEAPGVGPSRPSILVAEPSCGCGGHGDGGCACGGHGPDGQACGCGGSSPSAGHGRLMAWRRIHAGVGLCAAFAVVLHLVIAATAWLPPAHHAIVDGLSPLRQPLLIIGVAGLAIQAASGLVVLIHTGWSGGCRAQHSPRLALGQRVSAVVLGGFLLVHVGAALLRQPAAAPGTVVTSPSGLPWLDLILVGFTVLGGCAAAVHIGLGLRTAPDILGAARIAGAGRTPVVIAGVVAGLAVLGVAGMLAHG